MKEKIRKIVMGIIRRKLHNTSFTLISNNCIAGCVLHDLGLQFKTPTINLYIPFPDYVVFLENLRENLTKDLIYVGKSQEGAPIATLGGGESYSISSL